jgi:hypothetical protein
MQPQGRKRPFLAAFAARLTGCEKKLEFGRNSEKHSSGAKARIRLLHHRHD